MRHRESCRPPSSKTFLAIGQDLFSIEEYVMEQWNASLHTPSSIGSKSEVASLSSLTPAAVMVYSDIQTLRGLDHAVDYGSGVEFADGLLNDLFVHQSVGLQLGLWLNGTQGCLDILSGKLDSNLKRLFQYIGKCRANNVFLRLGYEFDNPWFGYSDNPKAYRFAFQKVVEYCRNNHLWCRNTSKVQFVWHSWAAPRLVSLEDFYPGDHVVDWMGISLFQQWYPWSVESGSPSDVQHVLEFAQQHGKPVMIAESTPFGGIEWNISVMQQTHNLSTSALAAFLEQDPWQRWFQPTLDLIERHDIAMWCYINCAWESQPMWKGVGFGETRLSTSPVVMDKWKRNVLDNPRFLMAGSIKDCKSSHVSLLDPDATVVTELQFAAPMTGLHSTTTGWETMIGGCIVAALFAVVVRHFHVVASLPRVSNPRGKTLQNYGSTDK